MNSILDDNSDSRDCDSQERNITANPAPTTSGASSGYYDAEKCRAHIANQIRVSKIDRFAVQISRALEVESEFQSRLGNVMNMFVKRSAQVTQDFTFKCKVGLQRHRQDRILNQQRKPSKAAKVIPRNQTSRSRFNTISNDLLYGPGVQLVHALLLSQTKLNTTTTETTTKTTDRLRVQIEGARVESGGLSESDYLMLDSFEPAKYAKSLEECIRRNVKTSKTISRQLNTAKQLFERLASDHRDKVDVVYAAEEERQAATVVRRSAYNLSMAAIKATSTPVHVNSNNEAMSSWNN